MLLQEFYAEYARWWYSNMYCTAMEACYTQLFQSCKTFIHTQIKLTKNLFFLIEYFFLLNSNNVSTLQSVPLYCVLTVQTKVVYLYHRVVLRMNTPVD